MAQNDSNTNGQDGAHGKFIQPLVTAGKCVVAFFDVATLFLRMLWNTLVHDTPHGKGEPSVELGAAKRGQG